MGKANQRTQSRHSKVMIYWMLNTKLGHFTFIVIFVLITGGIISLLTGLSFFIMIFVSIIAGVFLSIIDNNNKWY